MPANDINIKNKRASFEYAILEEYVAGIQLLGTEIKSIRESKASINEAFCVFFKDELYIRNMDISEYSHGNLNNHEPKRDRKLLLKRKELDKLKKKSQEKGLTIIPLRLFTNNKGLAKVAIALAKGKKLYDKRESLKTKDIKREIDRHLKSR